MLYLSGPISPTSGGSTNMLRHLVWYAFACFLVTLAGKFAICCVRSVYTKDDPQTTSELWDSLQALLAQVYLLRHVDYSTEL